MSEEKDANLKKFKLIKFDEKLINKALEFCEYYGIKIDANNIFLDDDIKALVINDISLEEHMIFSQNFINFIMYVFIEQFRIVEEIDTSIKHKINYDANAEIVANVCIKFKYRKLTYKEVITGEILK